MCLYNFLKQYTGIILTEHCLSLPNQMEVSKNMAKFSQLDVALKQIKSNPQNINKYLNTILSGFKAMNHEQMMNLKSMVNSGSHAIPSEANPVSGKDASNSLMLVTKCLELSEGEKAPGIKEFPGYLVTFLKWARHSIFLE